MSHHDLKLSVRGANVAKRVGVVTVGDLVRFTEMELLAAKCFGETSMREIKEALEKRELRLGMRPEELFGLEGLEAKIVGRGADDEDESDCCGDCRVTAQKLRARTEVNRKLAMSLDELRLPVRATRSLAAKGVTTVAELAKLTDDDLASIRNFGLSARREVKARLAELGLCLGAVAH